MRVQYLGLMAIVMMLCGCTDKNSASDERKYPDTAKGVADAMNDTSRKVIQEEESLRHPQAQRLESPQHYNQLGDKLLASKKYEEAIDSFNMSCQQGNEEGCKKYSYTLEYFKLHGPWIRDEQEHNDKQQIRNALADNPNDLEALNLKALGYIKNRKYSLAVKVYTKMLEIDPEVSGIYVNRGYAYDAMKKYDEAISDYDKAIKINPNSVKAYSNRGVLYATTGRIRLGTSDLQTACNMGDSRACGALTTFVHD